MESPAWVSQMTKNGQACIRLWARYAPVFLKSGRTGHASARCARPMNTPDKCSQSCTITDITDLYFMLTEEKSPRILVRTTQKDIFFLFFLFFHYLEVKKNECLVKQFIQVVHGLMIRPSIRSATTKWLSKTAWIRRSKVCSQWPIETGKKKKDTGVTHTENRLCIKDFNHPVWRILLTPHSHNHQQ